MQDKTLIHFPNFNIGFSNVRISPVASQQKVNKKSKLLLFLQHKVQKSTVFDFKPLLLLKNIKTTLWHLNLKIKKRLF